VPRNEQEGIWRDGHSCDPFRAAVLYLDKHVYTAKWTVASFSSRMARDIDCSAHLKEYENPGALLDACKIHDDSKTKIGDGLCK
jgi:hypothetical protein